MLVKVFDQYTGMGTEQFAVGATEATGVRLPKTPTVFLVLAFGTTISVQLEGSCSLLGADQTSQVWHPIITIDGDDTAVTPTTNAVSHTYTSGSPKVLIPLRLNEFYEFYRLNITANTGVTITAYLGCLEI